MKTNSTGFQWISGALQKGRHSVKTEVLNAGAHGANADAYSGTVTRK